MLDTVRLAVRLAVYMMITRRQNTHQAAATIRPEIQVGLPLSGPCWDVKTLQVHHVGGFSG